MAEIDSELLERIDRFLDRFGDTLNPVCMECLTEFSEGVRRCSDCHSTLVAGPRAVQELRALQEKGRRQETSGARPERDYTMRFGKKLVGDHATGPYEGGSAGESGGSTGRSPASTPGSPAAGDALPNAGDACPTCGAPFDPDVDVEGCENCRQLQLHEAEKVEEDLEPDPAEEAAVERFKAFLEAEPESGLSYCPGCLSEFREGALACGKCSKELLSAEDARAFAQRTIADLTARWFVPVMDDADGPFTARLIEALETAEDGPVLDVRVRREQRDFSPIFAIWRSYRSMYFVRRSQLPALRTWLASSDLGPEFAEQQQALIAHLDRLIAPVSSPVPR